MSKTAVFLATSLLSLLFAGCLDASTPTSKSNLAAPITELLAGAPLWNDPQNTPHPTFKWPTLSSPPDSANIPKWWKPIAAAKLPAAIKGLELLSKTPEGAASGAGIALFGSLAIVPGYGKPSAIVDISDPAAPKVLSTFKQQEGMGNHRGATVIAYPTGRLVTVISTGSGLDVWDITDPTLPAPLKPIALRSHKVGVVPGTPIVYNAASRGGGADANTAQGVTEIFDFSDPDEAVKVQDWKNGFSCHHVYFWNSPDGSKQRGVCAGVQYAQIWDTKDPRDPKVIVSVPMFHGNPQAQSTSGVPQTPWAHYAGLSMDGKILLVGDENGGGSSPPGCVGSANTAAGAVSTPIGALWFYDVSNEKSPKVLGWYSPLNDPRFKATPTTSCTAHHGRLVPAEGKNMVAMSFYGAGVVLIDFTGVGTAQGPLAKVVDQFAQGSDTWETWYYNGYLFTGDLVRGMDVLKFR